MAESTEILEQPARLLPARKAKGIGLMGDAAPADKETGEEYHLRFMENMVELIRYCEEDVKVELRKLDIPL